MPHRAETWPATRRDSVPSGLVSASVPRYGGASAPRQDVDGTVHAADRSAWLGSASGVMTGGFKAGAEWKLCCRRRGMELADPRRPARSCPGVHRHSRVRPSPRRRRGICAQARGRRRSGHPCPLRGDDPRLPAHARGDRLRRHGVGRALGGARRRARKLALLLTWLLRAAGRSVALLELLL